MSNIEAKDNETPTREMSDPRTEVEGGSSVWNGTHYVFYPSTESTEELPQKSDTERETEE